MRSRTSITLLAAGLSLAALADEPAGWGELLRAGGLEDAAPRLAAERWREGGARSLGLFERAWDEPDWLDRTAPQLGRALLDAGGSCEELLDLGQRLGDAAPVPSAGLVLAPRTAPGPRGDHAGAILAALAAIHSAAGAPLSEDQARELSARLEAVPLGLAARAALVLGEVPAALAAREAALAGFQPAGVAPEDRLRVACEKALAFGRGYRVDATTLELLAAVDPARLVEAGRGLARAIDGASAPLGASVGAFSFRWETPLGEVVLAGEGDDRHEGGPYLLVIDAGGDDVYRPVVPSDYSRVPLAIAIDLAGDDLFGGDGLQFGVGYLGWGFLVDHSGDDRHVASDLGPGSAIFGLGIALDRAGDDDYLVHRLGQGAAVCGLGVQADLAGDDRWRCLQLAQGFGGTLGVGALIDVAGDDRFLANDRDIEAPSAQTAEHNASLSQGCGFGRRAHPGDGHSFAGGLGIAVDGAGDDRWSCGVFGQGTGYWYAVGMLVDLAGDDRHEGVWYVGGSAAHYALGTLHDLSGDDRYLVSATQGLGAGHDWSVGLLADEGGDDEYRCPGWGLGAAHWSSLGLLRDGGGKDLFAGSDGSYGWAKGVAEGGRCIGLFIARGEARFEPARPDPAPLTGEPGLLGVRSIR